MTALTLTIGWTVLWLLWIVLGVFYDPWLDPHGKKSTRHTPLRFFTMFAYIGTVSTWVWICQRFGNGRDKTFGEKVAGVFVMLARKHANQAVLRLRGES